MDCCLFICTSIRNKILTLPKSPKDMLTVELEHHWVSDCKQNWLCWLIHYTATAMQEHDQTVCPPKSGHAGLDEIKNQIKTFLRILVKSVSLEVSDRKLEFFHSKSYCCVWVRVTGWKAESIIAWSFLFISFLGNKAWLACSYKREPEYDAV